MPLGKCDFQTIHSCGRIRGKLVMELIISIWIRGKHAGQLVADIVDIDYGLGFAVDNVYNALNEVVKEYPDARVFADIGCYTLGALPPFRAIDTCLDMGASITMAKGAADSGVFPAIAVIGDSTFTHSGMTGLLDAVNDKASITVIISDNLTTAMTGGQDSAGTNKFEAICLGLGVESEHVKVVVPLPKNMEEIKRTIREEIEYNGVSVIIPRRECIQTLNRKLKQKKH